MDTIKISMLFSNDISVDQDDGVRISRARRLLRKSTWKLTWAVAQTGADASVVAELVPSQNG